MTTITIDDKEFCLTKELAVLIKKTNDKAYEFATPSNSGYTAWQLEEISMRLKQLCALFPEKRGNVFKLFPDEGKTKIIDV